MDIHRIPFEDNYFDIGLGTHVLEHVNDDIRAMLQICRVLKPGRFSIMQVPFFNPVPDITYEDPDITNPRQRERIFGQNDHIRKYGRDYASRIEPAGLKAIRDDFVDTLSEETRQRYGLVKGEVVYGGRRV